MIQHTNPTILARISCEELEQLFRGYGYEPFFVEGSDRESMHQAIAATLEYCITQIRSIQDGARRSGEAKRPRWPMIVLRTPKGWTAPAEIDHHKVEGSWRAHQVPMTDVTNNPEHLKILENWLRSYKPEELFDASGRLIAELKAPGYGNPQRTHARRLAGRLSADWPARAFLDIRGVCARD
jgi:xylulose-5-phosphate/fructose-6-phosphate phosphoketolase